MAYRSVFKRSSDTAKDALRKPLFPPMSPITTVTPSGSTGMSPYFANLGLSPSSSSPSPSSTSSALPSPSSHIVDLKRSVSCEFPTGGGFTDPPKTKRLKWEGMSQTDDSMFDSGFAGLASLSQQTSLTSDNFLKSETSCQQEADTVQEKTSDPFSSLLFDPLWPDPIVLDFQEDSQLRVAMGPYHHGFLVPPELMVVWFHSVLLSIMVTDAGLPSTHIVATLLCDLQRLLQRFGDQLSSTTSLVINNKDGSDHLLKIMIRIFHILSIHSIYTVNTHYMSKSDDRCTQPIEASTLTTCEFPVSATLSQFHIRRDIEELSPIIVDQLVWLSKAIQIYMGSVFSFQDCDHLFSFKSTTRERDITNKLYLIEETYRNSKVDLLDRLMIELSCIALSDTSWNGPRVLCSMLKQREDVKCLLRESPDAIAAFKRNYRVTRMRNRMLDPSDSCRAVFCNTRDAKWRTQPLHASKSWLFLVTFQLSHNIFTNPLLIELCPSSRPDLSKFPFYDCADCFGVERYGKIRVCSSNTYYSLFDIFPSKDQSL